MEEGGRTAPRAGYDRGSSTWSAEILVGLASSDERKDFANASSVMIAVGRGEESRIVDSEMGVWEY